MRVIIAGFIGEEIVSNILGGEIENTYDYDVVRSGKKYDVKQKDALAHLTRITNAQLLHLTQSKNVTPMYLLECNTKTINLDQLGCWDKKNKNDYFREAKKLKKGQVDPSNNFTVKADCYNLSISELKPLEAKHGE